MCGDDSCALRCMLTSGTEPATQMTPRVAIKMGCAAGAVVVGLILAGSSYERPDLEVANFSMRYRGVIHAGVAPTDLVEM